MLRPAVRGTLRAVVLSAVAAGMAAGCSGGGGGGTDGEALLFVPEQAHFGATYGEWSARWWQWAEELPFSLHPLTDETGANAGQGQVDPVWFIGGEFATPFGAPDGHAERTMTIPKGRALFFPIANNEQDNITCNAPDYVPLSPSELANYFQTPRYDVRDVYCTVDDVTVVDSPDGDAAQRFRAKSSAFSFLLTADSIASNLCGAPPVATLVDPAYSDGLWVMLAPLAPGEHTVTFGAQFPPYPGGWRLDITYHITVTE